jgi:hypothetical protein
VVERDDEGDCYEKKFVCVPILTLLSHCQVMPSHRPFANSMSTHCLFTAYSLPIHCLYTAHSPPSHCLFTDIVLVLSTAYSPPIHCQFTAYSLPTHCLLTDYSYSYSLPIHCLFTAYSLPIHCLTTCSLCHCIHWPSHTPVHYPLLFTTC